MSITDEQLRLIAVGIAWANGEDTDKLSELAGTTLYLDDAQQCAEDAGLA